MQRLVLQSVLAAASALFLLQATACDKGGEKKADDKKVDDKKAEVVEPPPVEPPPVEPAGTTGAVEPVEPAGETSPGEAEGGGTEAGAGETGEPAPAGDSGKEPEAKPVEPKKTDDKAAAAKIDAKPIFESKCKSCHGSDGKGDTTIGKKVEIPSLHATKISKADAVKKITNGVPDTKMKGYADKLSKEEIDAVAAYVKKL